MTFGTIALIAFWLLCGIISGGMASGRGRDGAIWFLVGVLIGPLAIIALLIFGEREN